MNRLFLLLLLLPGGLLAQWQPGTTYREYVWTTPDTGEAFLRVGGRYGYAAQPGKLPEHLQRGQDLILPHDLDLGGATRATVTLEKVQSHEDSRDLRIAVNGHPAIPVPEPATIPVPQTEYMYHTDLTVDIPLEQLRAGADNRFRLTLDTVQRWGWPQNVFYALIFRVYYADEAPLPFPVGSTELPQQFYLTPGGAAGEGEKAFARVDYVLNGREADWSGRGVRERTHWQTFRGQPHHTVGSSDHPETDFAVLVDTEWLPEQKEEGFTLQFRARDTSGIYHVSNPTSPLTLRPRPYTVQVYGGEAPRNWVTRSGEFEQTLLVNDSVALARAIQLNWVSWSPCYSNGVFLNDHLIWDREGDCYVYATHSPTYEGAAVRYLQAGENTIRTALTPLFRGQMVHGMEVQWPGFQLKVKYGRAAPAAGH